MQADSVLQLLADADTGQLTAVYTPPPECAAPPADAAGDGVQNGDGAQAPAALPAWDQIAALAETRGIGREALDDGAIATFIGQCREAAGPVQAVVGRIEDGAFELEMDAARMSVLLTLTPPKGGKPVTLEDLRAALAAQGIVHGVQDAALAAALLEGRCEAVEIARGTPPTPGTPTRFESLLDRLKPRAKEIDELAQVDYRELGSLLLVSPGTLLMQRHPPLPGIDGRNVLGEPVLPAEPPDIPYARDLAGVALDPENPLLLRAAIAGTPKLVAHGVQVNPMVEVDAVDLSTGNINFQGSLLVRGDIAATMEVRVTGDVEVHGAIEAALVEAGGNVSVRGGIIGMADTAPVGKEASRNAHIVCGQSLKAKFIENAIISAGADVLVEREIRQSSIAAGGSVTVGPPNSQQSAITGGQTRALHAIRAGTIGSPAGIPTLVQAGLDPHADLKRGALVQRRARMNEEKAKLEQLLMFLQKHPERAQGDVLERARNTHTRLSADLLQLDQDEAQLARDLQPLQTATIGAARRFCGGVTLQLGNKVQQFLEDQIGGKAGLEEGEIVIR